MRKKTTTKKPAASAGKPARKTAKPWDPITIQRTTAMVFPSEMIAYEIGLMPVSRLKEMLRARLLPIPKDKETMVDRLTTWAVRDGGSFVLSLH